MSVVDPMRARAPRLALATAAGALALGACNDPEQNTDLRPDGPPEVLTVLVMTDAVSQLAERATYCKPGDEKRPDRVGLPDFTLQQVCDDDVNAPAEMVTNAYPDGWYVRIMFDELLDPNVEELVEIVDPETGEGTDTFSGTIANTQPVTLECESVNGGFVEVAYDGYYSPAGNRVTWPLGPSLVIKPFDPRAIATNKMCRVTIKDSVRDKSGEAVPADQRGPFEFKIAPIQPIYVEPADGSEVSAYSIYFDNVYVQFNTAVDEASLCDEGPGMDECEISITPEDYGLCDNVGGTGSGAYCTIGGTNTCPTGETCMPAGYYGYSLAPYGLTPAEIAYGPNAPLQSGKEYTFAFREGTKIMDRCGVETTFGPPSADDLTQSTFTTEEFDLVSIIPTSGDVRPAITKPTIQFNNVLEDPAGELVAGTDYTLTPAPASASVGGAAGGGGEIRFFGHYQPGTQYTLTIKAGSTVTEAHGKTYTFPAMDEVITWMTAPIAITSTSPANNGTSTKATPTSNTTIGISFNQAMDPATLTAADFEVTGGATFGAATVSGCGPTSTSCQLRLTTTAPLAPGSYTFTLKQGAQISDVLGNVYTQAAARTINFTVANAEPAVQCL